MKQKCRYCKCTNERPCPVGCEWITPDICSICAEFLQAINAYRENAAQATRLQFGRMVHDVLNDTLPLEVFNS